MGGYVPRKYPPTGLPTGLERDRHNLMSDLDIIAGDFDTVYERLLPAAKPASSPVEPTKPAPDTDAGRELTKLETAHAARLLELSSARRTLRTFRRGALGFLAGILTSLGLACAGIGTAVVTSVLGIDGTSTVVVLMLTGFPLLLISSVGMYFWHERHRIKVKRIERGYGTVVYEGVDYLDPKLNVELAEAEYTRALARLTEHKGMKSD